MLLGATTAANAISFDATLDGDTFSGGSFSADGGSVTSAIKDAGFRIIGVSGGVAVEEIDLSQALYINFNSPQFITSITLGLLFNGPEYFDTEEIAVVEADGSAQEIITITGEDTASVVGTGSAAIVPPFSTLLGGGGVFKLTNPFAGIAVTTLKLFPLDNGNLINNSDFGLVAFETVPQYVPDASSTLALLGLGLVGLAMVRRRK